MDVSDDDFQDAHAADIAKRFTNRTATTPQIILFGLTGWLLPCPAALTVLVVCLQLKEVTLGFTLVLCFSIGLALTLVATGTLAAWSVHHVSKQGRAPVRRHPRGTGPLPRRFISAVSPHAFRTGDLTGWYRAAFARTHPDIRRRSGGFLGIKGREPQ